MPALISKALLTTENIAGLDAILSGMNAALTEIQSQMTPPAAPAAASPAHAGPTILNARSEGARGDGKTDDAPALQAIIDRVKAAGSGSIYLPVAKYVLRSPLNLVEAAGINFIGDGSDQTILYGDGVPAVQTNGAWRCAFEGVRFQALSAGDPAAHRATFELDGNYDGKHTMGIQGCTFTRCYFDAAGLLPYAFALCRRGNNDAQGSENIFINCNFDSGLQASYYQNGYNALNNTFIGGNFQGHKEHGAQLIFGSANFYSVGFQSAPGWNEDVCDIDASTGGAYDELIMDGCRTESLRFFNGNFAQKGIIRGLNWTPPIWTWKPNTAVALDTVVFGKTAQGEINLYRVTAAGTTGAAQPPWSNPLLPPVPIPDGSAAWTYQPFIAINLPNGSIGDLAGSISMPGSAVKLGHSRHPIVTVKSDYMATLWDEIILVDTSRKPGDSTGGPVTVILPEFMPAGQRFTVKKIDVSANPVTVICGGVGLEGVENTIIPGGSRGYLSVVYDAASNQYFTTGRSCQ